MKFFNKFFKHKFEKIINIPEDIYENKKIFSHEEFYNSLGLIEYFNKMSEQNEFKKFHIYNVRANYKTQMKIYDFLKNNLIKTKNKYSRAYKEKALQMIAANDFLIWSPKTDENLKDNVIKIILPGHDDYTEVTKDNI